MDERFCDVGGGITLCYETFGDEGAPPLLLIMGLATQMIGWDERFCTQLADRGFRVIRFDNRDIGRSTHLDGARVPTPGQIMRRDKRVATYTLADMANDAAGLLKAIGAAPAHVVGASMGGMIAQTLAARRPETVRSLVSIMSNTGALTSGQPALRTYPWLLRRPPRERAAAVEHVVLMFSKIGSPGFPFDEENVRRVAELSIDRGPGDAAGTGRQIAAIMASGNRTPDLRRIIAPTLVIHGTRDRLVPPSGGRATARAIAGSRLLLIDGMGHDLPRDAWPRIIDGIAENAARAGHSRPLSRAA